MQDFVNTTDVFSTNITAPCWQNIDTNEVAAGLTVEKGNEQTVLHPAELPSSGSATYTSLSLTPVVAVYEFIWCDAHLPAVNYQHLQSPDQLLTNSYQIQIARLSFSRNFPRCAVLCTARTTVSQDVRPSVRPWIRAFSCWGVECRTRKNIKNRDFRPLSRFISEMIQDRAIVTISLLDIRRHLYSIAALHRRHRVTNAR